MKMDIKLNNNFIMSVYFKVFFKMTNFKFFQAQNEQKQLSWIYATHYEYGTCFRASYSKLGSKLTLYTLDTHILPYDLFLDG